MSESNSEDMMKQRISIRHQGPGKKVVSVRSEFDVLSFEEYEAQYPVSVHADKAPPWQEGDAQPFTGEALLDGDLKKMVTERTRSANSLMITYNNHINCWLDDASHAIAEAKLAKIRFEQQSKLLWSEGGGSAL